MFCFWRTSTSHTLLPTPTYSYLPTPTGFWAGRGGLAGAWRIHRVQGFSASYP